MVDIIVIKTKHGDDIHFKMENNNLMVFYKAVYKDFMLLTEFIENNILSKYELEILAEGSMKFGLRLIFKPTLIRCNNKTRNEILKKQIFPPSYDEQHFIKCYVYFKKENNKIQLKYSRFNDYYISILDFFEKYRPKLTSVEISTITEGCEEYGFRPTFKPTLVKK